MKTSKKIIILSILFLLYLLFSIFSYANAVSTDIANSVFRLHVIANSNELKDQELKLKVRDALIQYMNSFAEDIVSKDDAISFVSAHKENLKEIAEKIIHENGYSYPVALNIDNFSFPTKKYGDVTLPAGFYDALKVEIGNSAGQNWWCVLFPALCFVDVSNGIVPESSKETLQNTLQEEDYNLITSAAPEYQLKFKLLELFENAKMVMAKK